MEKPLISVIICTYNRAGMLRGCVESLIQQTLPGDLYEVIIVDNNSDDETNDMAQRYASSHQNIRLVHEQAQGLSHARNRGWKEARGKYIAYIDDDARAAPEWCAFIVHAFETVNPQPAAVGGEILPLYDSPPPPWFSDDFERHTWGNDKGFLRLSGAKMGFSGSNMTLRRDLFEKFGGFSTSLGMAGGKIGVAEESEFFARVYEHEPLFWYDPAIQVFHHVPLKNMSIVYRLTRAFKSGQTIARIDRKNFQQAERQKVAKRCLLLAAEIPYRFLLDKQTCRMVNFAKRLNFFTYLLGYLFSAERANFWHDA
ncbi:MAG: glycosyltransferase family 2 protein [Deltaproteobacteria bacterium]|nr:glycosyltransferase family 2 protein [Deltaproteobacteria bacterium]